MYALEWQGQVFVSRNLSKMPPPPEGLGKRKSISSFSAGSRRRMIDFLARMNVIGKRLTFITLTYSVPPTHEEAKAALKRFLQRCREYWPEASAVWRMEYQERGAIHFHLLFFNLPYWPQYHLQDTWTECTDEALSIAHVTLIHTFRKYMSYISKYIAKKDDSESNPSLVNPTYQQNTPPGFVGRFWGYLNKSALPLAEKFVMLTDDEELGRYAAWSIHATSRGRSGESEYSQKLYSTDAGKMFNFCVHHSRSTQDAHDLFLTHHHAPRQWFGSPAVPSGIGVPLAG